MVSFVYQALNEFGRISDIVAVQTLSILFLVLVFVMASVGIGLFARYLKGRARIGAIAVFVAWLLYAGIMGHAGIIASKRSPGPVLLLAPVLLFLVTFLTRYPRVRTFAQRVPAELLLGLQAFRIFVELGFHELYELHLVPRMLTFEGANFDIVVGLTAPLVAWLYASGRIRATAVRVWSFAGIAILTNIIVRAVLTIPGPLNFIRTEVPNVAFGLFPFSYIPGFLAPLALYLHVLLLRSVPRDSDLQSSK